MMKMHTIKKLFELIGILIWMVISNTIRAQSPEINFGNYSRPVASVSSLAAYNNTPVSIASGIPGITIPLFELSTRSNRLSLPLALAYNSTNVKQLEPASDTGTGWSLLAGGVISREVIGSLNEVEYSQNPQSNSPEMFNDIFYYNLPGISGKFKFNKNVTSGGIDIENLSANKIKISYVRDTGPSPYFMVSSFTITDESGYKYIFKDYSESSNFVDGIYQYRSAFFLSQIKLPDDTIITNFEYRKDSKHATDEWTSPIVYTSCKLSKINAEGVGSINLDYVYDATKEKTMNDPYSISQILLKDSFGKIISGYKFNYNWVELYPSTPYDDTETKGRRLLDKLIKVNSELVEYEKTSFVYNPYQTPVNEEYSFPCTPTSIPNPGNYEYYQVPGLLKRIVYPMGGAVDYTYEAHDYFFNRNSPQYLENALGTGTIIDPVVQDWSAIVPILNIDTNQSSDYNLTITGNPTVKKSVALQFIVNEYYPPGIWVPDTPDPNDQPDPGGNPQPGGHYEFNLTYILKKNGEVVNTFCVSNEAFIYQLLPGNYTVSVSGTGGKAQLLMSQIILKNGPYPNKKSTYKYGPRLKNIKYYSRYTDTIPVKTEQYNYAAFSDPISSSGYIFRNESEKDNFFPGYILYKNVAVTDSENGLVKYYYKNPDDYPKTVYTVGGVSTTFWHYYTITKSGVLEKKEVYNVQNQLLSSSEYESEFETLQNLPDVKIEAFQGNLEKYTKPAYIKNVKTITKDYSGSTYSKTINETIFNAVNFKSGYIKNLSSDGITTEKWIRYASDKNKIQLVNGNVVSVPLETETKVNGKTTDKTETMYGDSGRFDPLSITISNPENGSSKTAVKYETYNSYGNIRQYSTNVDQATGTGFSTVVIWGYNQTLPIAKIKGAKLSDIGNLADDIIAKSNADINVSTEATLLQALDLFRSNDVLKNFQITTYSYDPLIGTTTITPPSGIREYYKYDNNGRLKTITDVNGNILQEYKYNTKPQP